MLISVKEYAAKMQVSPSTVQRRLNKGELRGKRFGRVWYVLEELAPLAETGMSPEVRKGPMVSEVIAFSSKALNSYLMMSDRLLLEKERQQQQQLEQLQNERLRVAELQAYVALLEKMLFSERTDRSAPYAAIAPVVQHG